MSPDTTSDIILSKWHVRINICNQYVNKNHNCMPLVWKPLWNAGAVNAQRADLIFRTSLMMMRSSMYKITSSDTIHPQLQYIDQPLLSSKEVCVCVNVIMRRNPREVNCPLLLTKACLYTLLFTQQSYSCQEAGSTLTLPVWTMSTVNNPHCCFFFFFFNISGVVFTQGRAAEDCVSTPFENVNR